MGTDPRLPDTDFDGLLDGEDPNPLFYDCLPLPPFEDADFDGLINQDECFYMTNPLNPDTDGDGFFDWDEVFIYGTDPRDPNSIPGA